MTKNPFDAEKFLERLKADPDVLKVATRRPQSRPLDGVAYNIGSVDEAVSAYESRRTPALKTAQRRPRILLRAGDQGDAVARLQGQLQTQGFAEIAADGVFGAETEAAVRRFQSANNLVADGIAGPQTMTALGLGDPT